MRIIVEALATIITNRDLVVDFAERVVQDPTRPVVRSQRLEPSSDPRFGTDEPLTKIGARFTFNS